MLAEDVLCLQWYDANVSLPGCDKNMPGVIIAMARLNRPALMVYGGTIKPGYSGITDKPIDVVSAFQSYGAQLTTCVNAALRAHSEVAAPCIHRGCCRPAQSVRVPLLFQRLDHAWEHLEG